VNVCSKLTTAGADNKIVKAICVDSCLRYSSWIEGKPERVRWKRVKRAKAISL